MFVRTVVVERLIGSRPLLSGPTLLLVQNNWDDKGFRTTYNLFFADDPDKRRNAELLIGEVKILRSGQEPDRELRVHEDFPQLGPEFCSVGTSLDYYERLAALPDRVRRFALKALCDVVANPRLVERFETEPGWLTSLFRGQKDPAAHLELARSLLTGDFRKIANETVAFSFLMPGWTHAVRFDFGPPEGDDDVLGESRLPSGIVVLIGKNGSGKSTLLARLARVAIASTSERSSDSLSPLGALEPAELGFARVITVTFSPFDSFRLPGSDASNRKQFLKDMEQGAGRFAFIGLRDISAEGDDAQTTSVMPENEKDPDRRKNTRLKSIEHLSDEFVASLERAHRNVGRLAINDVQDELFPNGFFGGQQLRLSTCPAGEAKRLFLALSTGHKIVLLVTTGLLSKIKPHTLLLMDEPETHLHPPLLAALMHTVRKILRRHKSFAVVATHSPVVVQETLAQHVYIVRNAGALTSAEHPQQETFGENIGQVSSEVFGLHSEVTDFHAAIERLVRAGLSLKEMDSLFTGGRMSHQARGYAMSRLAERKN